MNELYHHGIKGMKWGVRRTPAQLGHLKGDSSVTRKVKDDYNKMSDPQFKSKYRVSKGTYARRVEKYGDPYKNAPLAKAGRALNKKKSKSRGTHDTSAEDYQKAHSSKSVKQMSDAELRSRLNRLQMEQQYSKLSPSAVGKGKKYAKSALAAATTIATATTTGLTIYNNADKIKKILNG